MSDIQENVFDESLDDAFASRFGEYATAVIKSRAIPSIEDGLLPVMRRSLYAIHLAGEPTRFRKAAKFVGDILGSFHPHGDLSVYSSMMGMSQDFNKLNIFIDPQGNVGKISGDSYAAMRYVELRPSKFSIDTFFSDFNKNYVKFKDNYDSTTKEPVTLPSMFPVILNSGIDGIGSGFISSIPPHKVDDICDITIKLIRNPEIKIKDLVKNFRPDFPMGAEIINEASLVDTYTSGNGVITLQAKIVEEKVGKKTCLVVKDLPYKVTTNTIIQQIADLAKTDPKTKEPGLFADKIDAVEDFSSRNESVNLVITPKKDVSLDVLRNLLYENTRLRSTIKYMANVLYKGEFIEKASIKTILEKWIDHRISFLGRKYNYEIKSNSETLALKKALVKAQAKIDEVIAIVKTGKSEDDVVDKLRELLNLTDKEARYIANIRLYKIAKVEVQKLKEEIKDLQTKIDGLVQLISSKEAILDTIVKELEYLKNKYKSDRRTQLSNTKADSFDVRNVIESEDLVIAISSDNYIYAKPVADMKEYVNRGAKGSNFIDSKYKKIVRDMFMVNSHDDLFVFTDTGKVIELKGYQLNLWHKSIRNAIPDLGEQNVISVIKADFEADADKHIVFCTKDSLMKRVAVSDMICQRKMKGGNIAVTIPEGDALIGVAMLGSDNDQVIITSNHGRMQRLPADNILVAGRPTSGRPRALIDSEGGEFIQCMTTVAEKDISTTSIIVAATTGIGKLVSMDELPIRRKEGGGRAQMIKIISLTGVSMLVCGKAVNNSNQIVATTSSNKSIKLDVNKLNSYGRTAKGSKIVTIDENETLIDITVV